MRPWGLPGLCPGAASATEISATLAQLVLTHLVICKNLTFCLCLSLKPPCIRGGYVPHGLEIPMGSGRGTGCITNSTYPGICLAPISNPSFATY